ncbi:MAG: transglycosylase [Bacteroidetes bacterium CG2_30_33_31]|nr:MAG: transglycosylase [Bacteroidetes bacterium CG2_30_33_31]
MMGKFRVKLFKFFGYLLRQIPAIINFIRFLLSKFFKWRKARMHRYHRLVWYRKILNITVTSFVYFLIFLFLVDINFLWLFGKSPGIYAISHPDQSNASIIISADGKVIGKYFRENRMSVKFEEISPIIIKTLIATEDERFYQHFGIDVKGVFAAIKDMMHGNARGASTITQQLVKNMYKTRGQYSRGLFGHIPGVKLLIMKTKEWTSAVKIEIFYSKEEILTMYFNTVDFGSNAFGIRTAAKTYFKIKPRQLNYEQSALLVGLLKATSTYNPKLHPIRSKERRNVVLQNLVSHKILTQHQFDSIKEIPILLNYSVEQSYDGEALHFRAYLAKYLKDWEEANGYDIYSDGLKIYVTIDSRMQKYAEEAVQKQMHAVQRRFFEHWRGQNPWQDENHVEIKNFIEDIAKKTKSYSILDDIYHGNIDSIFKYLNNPHRTIVYDFDKGEKDTTFSVMDSIRYMNNIMHSSFVAMEPNTGKVKAWVGDISFKFWQYDKVAQSKRQPGSTFKLFDYTAAIMNGKSPCDLMTDKPVTWNYVENGQPKSWTPRNTNGTYLSYPMTLKHAFARSINSVAVQVAQEVGMAQVIKYAYLLGIKTPLDDKPSTSLGSSDVSLLELVNSYSTVINEGMYHDPIIVSKIEDKNGNVIYVANTEQKRVIPYESAWLMTEMLKGGMTEPGGITQALWEWDLFKFDTDFGGKTGTSSNHSDAWFVGVTKNLIGGAWVGGEQRCVHFRTGVYGEGSRTALPVYALFMEKVLKDESLKQYRGRFPTKPKETITKSYTCHTYVRRDSSANDSLVIPDMPEGVPLEESTEIPVEVVK